jgi:hypothetical protein
MAYRQSITHINEKAASMKILAAFLFIVFMGVLSGVWILVGVGV